MQLVVQNQLDLENSTYGAARITFSTCWLWQRRSCIWWESGMLTGTTIDLYSVRLEQVRMTGDMGVDGAEVHLPLSYMPPRSLAAMQNEKAWFISRSLIHVL
jgi:hypothetical protein